MKKSESPVVFEPVTRTYEIGGIEVRVECERPVLLGQTGLERVVASAASEARARAAVMGVA